jgi:hypothetical protein
MNTDVATFGGNAKVSLSGVSVGTRSTTFTASATAYREHDRCSSRYGSNDRTQANLFGNTSVDGSGFYEY